MESQSEIIYEDYEETPEVEIYLKNIIHNDKSLFVLMDADGHLMQIIMKDKDKTYIDNAIDYLVKKHNLFVVLALELINQWQTWNETDGPKSELPVPI